VFFVYGLRSCRSCSSSGAREDWGSVGVWSKESVRFARQAGASKITLRTQSILRAARHLYEPAGFALVREEPHHGFADGLFGETWEPRL
jgi:hypothetical protein